MKPQLVFALLLFCFFSCKMSTSNEVDKKNATETVLKLDWLVGQWKRANEKEGKTTFENWEKKNDKEFAGFAYTLQKGDTVWQEKMRLVQVVQNWDLEVSGEGEKSPTIFKMTSLIARRFVCENPAIEFPKRIEYFFEDDKLKAKVSGGEMVLDFEFDPVEPK